MVGLPIMALQFLVVEIRLLLFLFQEKNGSAIFSSRDTVTPIFISGKKHAERGFEPMTRS
jgi:hypothetical protein